jgi:hypothetical protein
VWWMFCCCRAYCVWPSNILFLSLHTYFSIIIIYTWQVFHTDSKLSYSSVVWLDVGSNPRIPHKNNPLAGLWLWCVAGLAKGVLHRPG